MCAAASLPRPLSSLPLEFGDTLLCVPPLVPGVRGVLLPYTKALKGSLLPSHISTKALFAANTEEIS